MFVLSLLRKSYGASVYLSDKLHGSRSPFPPARFVSIPSTAGPCELRGHRDTHDREKCNPYGTRRPLGRADSSQVQGKLGGLMGDRGRAPV